ncbi:MFS transporter [Phormidium tenue FACHB-886]|nr:MFS transporter [Phormidium tenue FACHB-886]
MTRPTDQAHLLQLEKPILWLPITALAALYGIFTFSWVSYRIHLPSLMTQFGFSPQSATQLLLIEALLAIVLEPCMGYWSDRLQQHRGDRFPLISIGVLAASGSLVILVLSVAFSSRVREPLWLPGLLLVWAIGMTTFRTPALALLRRFSSTSYLVFAAGSLTLATGLAASLNPLARSFILNLGIPIPFILSAILLVVTATSLRSFTPKTRAAAAIQPGSLSALHLGSIFVVGMATTLVVRLAIEVLPAVLKGQLPSINPPLFAGLMLVTSALAALPVGKLAVQWGYRRVMLLGLVTVAVLVSLTPLIQSVGLALAMGVAIGIAFSTILNGGFPFSFLSVPADYAGLAIGTFFGGAASATSLVTAFLSQSESFSSAQIVWLSLISCLIAIAGILISGTRFAR